MSTSGWAYSHKLFQWFICPEQWVVQRNFFLSGLVAGISLTNMWVGLFIADFHIITISASVERVVEKLPHCPLHLEGLNETHWEPGQFGQGRVFPHISCLRAGVRPMKLSLPSALQRVKLILAICRHPADISPCLWVSWFWHLLDTHGLFIVFQLSLCVLREKYLIKSFRH